LEIKATVESRRRLILMYEYARHWFRKLYTNKPTEGGE
jgi:hypothetical protein